MSALYPNICHFHTHTLDLLYFTTLTVKYHIKLSLQYPTNLLLPPAPLSLYIR